MCATSSHEDTAAQSHDVEKVLGELGIAADDPRLIEVWNKIDRLDAEARARLANLAGAPAARAAGAVPVSAVTGRASTASPPRSRRGCRTPADAGSSRSIPPTAPGLSWLYRHSEVL